MSADKSRLRIVQRFQDNAEHLGAQAAEHQAAEHQAAELQHQAAESQQQAADYEATLARTPPTSLT